MKRFLIAAIATLSAIPAQADIFTYTCKAKGRPLVAKIDDTRKIFEWRGKLYKLPRELSGDECAKFGWRAEGAGEYFNFCTATKRYADFEEHGSTIVCQQQVGPVPQEYLGHWALVPEKDEKCASDNGPAEVTSDNIQTYHEDYCRVLSAREVKQPSDTRVEITCMSGGEGSPETKAHETWRLRNMFGKQVFIEQGIGGIVFWQRCP